MGLFGSKNSKLRRIISNANTQAQRQAVSQGGCCENCREYDAFREVCTGPVTMGGKQAGHPTSPDSVCPHWRV